MGEMSIMKKLALSETAIGGESYGPIPNYRVLTIFLATFLAGVFIASFFNLDFFQIYYFGIITTLVIVAANFLINGYLTKIFSAAATMFLIGFLLFSYTNTKLSNLNLPFDQNVEFSGIISSYPNIDGNSQNFYLETTDFGPVKKIYVSTSVFPNYSYGNKIKIKTTITRPINISSFDWVSYLKRFGTVATTANSPEIALISADGGNKLLKKLYAVRKSFEIAVQKTLPEPESSLGIGILIGSKQGFSKDLINDFAKVGITHIIALSGYNVTIIIIFLTDILLGLISRKKIFILSIMLICGFVAMTGAASSVIRAAIITLLIAFGKTIGRRADMTNLILLSAAAMVAINPFVLRFDTGFQLSFLAFTGLVYFSPIVEKIFSKKFFKVWPNFIKSAVTETLSAQIFVLPLILSTFGLISIIAPVTNVLILPTVPAIMLFVFLSTIIYWIVPVIGKLTFLICYLPLKYIILVSEYFARLPIAAIQISGNWQTGIIIIYILLLGFIIFKNKKIYDPQTN